MKVEQDNQSFSAHLRVKLLVMQAYMWIRNRRQPTCNYGVDFTNPTVFVLRYAGGIFLSLHRIL